MGATHNFRVPRTYLPTLTTLYNQAASLWPAIYANRFTQMGTTATICAFGDTGNAGAVTASTFLGIKNSSSGLSPTWTPTAALSAWATAFDLTLASNFLGCAPILTFDGTNDGIETPDDSYFTRGNGTNDSAFSLVAWVNIVDTAASRILFGKWNGTGSNREYQWIIQTDDKMYLYQRDEVAAKTVSRATDAAPTAATWHQLCVTSAGTGGATAMNGVTMYVDGAAVASTATNDAAYVAMNDKTGKVEVGQQEGGTSRFQGMMLGGPFGLAFCQAQLTAAQVYNLYAYERLALGV